MWSFRFQQLLHIYGTVVPESLNHSPVYEDTTYLHWENFWRACWRPWALKDQVTRLKNKKKIFQCLLWNQRTDWQSELLKIKWEGCGRIWNFWVSDYQLNHRSVFDHRHFTDMPNLQILDFWGWIQVQVPSWGCTTLLEVGLSWFWSYEYSAISAVGWCYPRNNQAARLALLGLLQGSHSLIPVLSCSEEVKFFAETFSFPAPGLSRPHLPSPEALSPVQLICRS